MFSRMAATEGCAPGAGGVGEKCGLGQNANWKRVSLANYSADRLGVGRQRKLDI